MDDYKRCTAHSGIIEKIDSLKGEVELRFRSLESATVETRRDLDRRLETMNEFREQLDRQAKTFASKSAIDVSLSNHAEKIEQQRKEMSGMKNWLIGLLVAVIINLVGVILLLIRS